MKDNFVVVDGGLWLGLKFEVIIDCVFGVGV